MLPATGADGAGPAVDDGITFVGATYLGSPVTSVVLTFDGAGNATHPYARTAAGAPVIVTGTPGNQLVVLQLPFGSFTASQPPVDILVTTALSNQADVNTALNIQARGGFQYGADALDNPSTDPSIVGSYTPAATAPTVLRLAKTYIGPEDETATGPNFPRQYLIEVDIANGQTLTDLDLIDILPPTLQFVSVDATTIRGTVTPTTSVSTPSLTTPGGTVTRRFSSVTGTGATNDATLLFTFYVPRLSASAAAIINPSSGDDAQSIDDARTQGIWDPIDARDAAGLTSSDITPTDHILTDKSLAIQKGVAIVTDTGATGPSPGDTLEYTLDIQISDFFAFENLIVTDVIADGLRAAPGFVPTLRVTQHGNPSSAPMAPANYSFVVDSPGTGDTTGTFSLSAELITRTLGGQVLGGCVPVGGTGGPAPDCTAFNGGATTATIVYRAVIQEDYSDTFPSGDPSVDEGDVLSNDVDIIGDVLSSATLAPTGQNEGDDSGAEVTIAQGQLFKSVYAVNGSTSFPTPIRIGPGDTITYQLRLTLPTSDIEPLTITDYLPLPIFDATQVTTFVPTASAASPPAGQAKFGPTDTFFAASGLIPVLSSDATSNSLSFEYLQHDTPAGPPTTIDLLFTVTASADPFADGLFLTNQVEARQSTTQLEPSGREAIVQIQMTEPDVRITKGVVATNGPAGVFSPAAVGPVSFSAPGSAGYRGSGPITSTNLGVNPIDSNVSNVDAADLVTFAIVVENRGSGVRGAFDIRVRDLLPAGFQVPGGGLNLQVTSGTGAPLPFTVLGTGLLDPAGGIELNDGADGALGPFDPSSGLNIAILTFDLELVPTVSPEQVLTNTATLFNFAGAEGGPDFTTSDRADVSTVTVAEPGFTKTIVTTSQPHTAGNNLAIGETVQYELVVRVPEGASSATTLNDALPLGLAVVSLDSLVSSSGAVVSSNGSFATVLANAIVSPPGADANAGRNVQLNFGTLTNSDTDNATAETLTLRFTAALINGGSNDRGETRTNAANFSYTGGLVSTTSPQVTIVEPTLQVAKTALPTVGDAGDPITFAVVISHAVGSNATAFDVTLADVLPAGLTVQSATHTAGTAPTPALTPTATGFTATFPSLTTAQSSTFEVVATLDNNLASGQVLTNRADTTWTSLPGGVTGSPSPFTTLDTERTGSIANPGGAVNNYTTFGEAAVTGLAATPTKTIISTSLPSTTGNNVAIGEHVQYQVQVAVPEGTNSNVTLVDNLGAGLAFLSLDSVTVSSPSVTTNVPGGFPGVLTSAAITNSGQRATFTLGTLTNSDVDNGTTEMVTFVYTAIATNVGGNQRGTLLTNVATWSSDGSSVNTSAPNVTIVEPTLQVVKGASPTSTDAGATVTFTLTISHAAGSDSVGYDAVVTDAVPAGMTYVPGSATHTGGVAPSVPIDFAGGTLTVRYASLATTESSVITFQATLANTVTPGQVITNTANVTWTSLPGDLSGPQSPHNPNTSERTGAGGVNDYAANDPQAVTVHESTLAGWVYLDSNNDGQRTPGEPGIPGVPIQLTGTDHLGNPVSLVVMTQPDGSYSFTDLRPGTYTISETQPPGYADGTDVVGTPALGATAGNDALSTIAIPAGANTNGIDFNFGEVLSSELSITKTGTPDSVLPGGLITYTIEVTNAGPNDAVNAVLTDPLPGGTTFVSLSSPGGWGCTTPAPGAAGTVSCTNAVFTASTATFTLVVQADAGLALHSTLRNVATITSASADTNPKNNVDDEPTIVAGSGEADLEVTKTDSADPVLVGQPFSYTLTVTNHGPASTTATVTDTLPAEVSFVSMAPSAGSCDPSSLPTITCTIPGMVPGATETITVQVTAATPGVATNQVSVDADPSTPDPNPANNQATEPTTITDPAGTDLSIVKTGPLTVARGGPLTYRLLVTNHGANAADLVQVADPLVLPGLTFVSNAGDCATVFPCALGTIAAGDSRTIVSTYTVDAAYAGTSPIVNTATVSTTTPESNLANNSSEVSTLVADPSAADLTVVKLDSPDAAVAGTQVTYTLFVTNNGPGAAVDAAVTDTLPASMTFVSATSSQGSCSGTGPVVCTLGNLANGANATIAITVQASSALPTPNPVLNSATTSATSSDPEPSNDTSTQPTTIVARTDLEITKSAPLTITAGSPLTYVIVVANVGPSDAADVVVNDPTPTGLLFTSNAGDCTTVFPCNLGIIPAGQTRTITATFAVPSSYMAPDPIQNMAVVSSSTQETNPANNQDSTATTLVVETDLGVTKIGPATAVAGERISYTIVVTNHGPSDASNVLVDDPTPTNLTFAGNSGDCTTTWPCSYLSLPAGETLTIVSQFDVPSGYSGPTPILNTVTVSTTTTDTVSGNNNSTATTTLGPPSADVAVVKNGPAIAIPGNPIVYTITVTNNGPSDAADVTLTDPTPTGLSFVSNAGDCTTPFPCSVGTLLPGETRTVTSTVMVPGTYTTPDQITNIATVSSTTADPNLGNNESTAVTSTGADLVVTKVVNDATPNVTDTVLFTVTIRNAGPSPATGVALVDAMPAGLTLLAATPSVGTYDPASGLWTVGALAVNATVTLTLEARVDVSGGMTNVATITAADQSDLDSSNNTAGAALNVPAAADLQVLKTVDRPNASVGTNVTFTISVRNAGPDAATGVVIADALPAGLTFVSAAPSVGTYDPATGAWTIGTLALNGTATLAMTATVEAEGTMTNTAQVSGRDQFDPAPGNDAAGVSVNGLSADLQVVKTVDRSAPALGDQVTFTIVVTNNGPGEGTNVSVRDMLPSSLAFVGSTATQGLYVPETGLWSVGTLAAPGSGGGASSATLQITTTVVAEGGAVNTARVAAGDQPDPNPANDTNGAAFGGVSVDLEAGLSFTGDADAVGRLFDFFVSVTNRADRSSQEPLVVAIPFPAELAFNAPQTTWPCEAVGRTLFCEHELETPLNQNQSKSLAYWADVMRVFPRGLAAYAHVASAQDADVANNVGAVLLTPPAHGSVDLRVTQTMTSVPGLAPAGPVVTYRAEVVNASATAASEVTLVDVLPVSLTLLSIVPEAGSCAGTRRIACALGTLAPGRRVVVTITGQASAVGLIAHTVSVSGREADPDLTNNAARVAFSLAAASNPSRDTDGDDMPDVWESQMGLNPGVDDGGLDPDGDGLTNAQEFARHSHPRGFYRQLFAEGVTNGFFDTMFSLVNPSTVREASVAMEMMHDTGDMTTTLLQLGTMRRQDASARDLLGAWQGAFSTLIESDQPIASDRLTSWDPRSYGTALETGLPAASTNWLFAEGATHGFQLFYLLQNPDMMQPADVTIRYLLPSGTPVVKPYTVAPHSRLTIHANEIPELAGTDVSAEIVSTRPIVAERAMYRGTTTQVMAAGHVAAGATAASTTWLFAEGATGDFFNLYLLLGNPNPAMATVDVRYLLPDGRTVTKPYDVGANSRRTISVAGQDPLLAATSVGMSVTSTLPIVAERAMWWPGPSVAPEWYESHVVLGATEAGTRWAVASGAAGGPLGDQTFVLVANHAAAAGRLRVTAVLNDGTTRLQEMPIAATARVTLDIASLFAEAANQTFSVIVESIGGAPVPITVEGARYASPEGQLWGAGGAALATKLQ